MATAIKEEVMKDAPAAEEKVEKVPTPQEIENLLLSGIQDFANCKLLKSFFSRSKKECIFVGEERCNQGISSNCESVEKFDFFET